MTLSREQLADIALILGINALPVLGVLLAGWNAMSVVIFYWFETAIFGFWAILQVLVGGTGKGVNAFGRMGTAGFLVVHAGIFMIVHLIFIFVLFGDGFPAFGFNPSGFLYRYLLVEGLGLPLFVVLILRGISELIEARKKGADAAGSLSRFYARIVVMQISTLRAVGW